MITKAVRFQIIKPLDTDWKEFGSILQDLTYKTTKMCNAAVQLYWENHNYRLQHKNETGKYPDAKMEKEKYSCSFRNYVYRYLREIYPEIASTNTSQTNQFAMNRWKNDVPDIMRLKKSIPSFRMGTPIQISNSNYNLHIAEGEKPDKTFSWSNLIEKIKYKAEEKGIVVEISDKDSKTTCSKCGYSNPENVEGNTEYFTCKNPDCGAKINMDYNTVLNIAHGC